LIKKVKITDEKHLERIKSLVIPPGVEMRANFAVCEQQAASSRNGYERAHSISLSSKVSEKQEKKNFENRKIRRASAETKKITNEHFVSKVFRAKKF
jgi:hypothetical protein